MAPRLAKRHDSQQLAFAEIGATCTCGRCGQPCKVDPIPGSKAVMMKRSAQPKGLCIHCAVHDTLRHIYPANLLLARSAGKTLAHPDIQEQFFAIAQMAGTDASFEEIDWEWIIDHWDLRFPTPIKRTATNPVTEEEMAMARLEGEQRRAGTWKEPETEEEYQARRKEAEDKFISLMERRRHEDPPPDHRDGG